jgi:type IV pilus assembly protein PilM
MFGMGTKTIVGLDVGSSSIKAVELRKTRTGIEVAHLGLEPIAPDIVVDSMIVDSGTVSSGDRQAVHRYADQVESGGHGGERTLGDREENLAALDERSGTGRDDQKEAAQHIPFDLADVNLDYQILSDDATSPQMDVLLVAVKKDKILNYTNVLSMAGKTPAIVDIDALALQNCYEFNYEPAPTQVVACSTWVRA